MCGKDGTQRGVYKLKGEHERGDRNRKRKKKKRRKQERKKGEKKRVVLVTREKRSIVPIEKTLNVHESESLEDRLRLT